MKDLAYESTGYHLNYFIGALGDIEILLSEEGVNKKHFYQDDVRNINFLRLMVTI